jgi:hypothetical protein
MLWRLRHLKLGKRQFRLAQSLNDLLVYVCIRISNKCTLTDFSPTSSCALDVQARISWRALPGGCGDLSFDRHNDYSISRHNA